VRKISAKRLPLQTLSNLPWANVALFAASQGLAAWFHNCDRETAGHAFKLKPNRRVLFAQSVGMKAR
jgi:hypothetical protein